MKYLTTSHASPPPNLPSGDLLTGNRDDYYKICVPLHNASMVGDWKAVEVILGEHQHLDLLGFGINDNYDTALHVAASAKNTISVQRFVKKLVNLMTKEQLELRNRNYNTALCLAAASGNVEIVKTMVTKDRALLEIPGSKGMMPLYMASLLGKKEMVNYLYQNSNQMGAEFWTDEKRGWVLQKCVEADLFGVALKILTDRPVLTANYVDVLGVLARKTDAFEEIRQNRLRQRIVELRERLLCIIRLEVRLVKKADEAMQLLRIIWANILKLSKHEIDEIMRGPVDVIITEGGKQKPKHSSRVLFIAAELGNTNFIVELIRQCPDLMWGRNDNNQTIFHVAVSHRHQNIYNILHEIGLMKYLITPLMDGEGNNMLHLSGKSAKKERVRLPHETFWFKEVEALMPFSYREQKNKDGLTPHELFMEEHKDSFSENEKWIKDTANQALVVAALIASIGFAAAITVPGGNNQGNGYPTFLQRLSFKIFVIFDAISFICSTTSILLLLSIFLSGYAETNYMELLPKRMMFGLSALLYSINTMLISFTATSFLLYQDKLIWVPITVTVLISLLYTTSTLIYVPIMQKLLSGSNLIPTPRQQRLYYQSPRF